MEKCYVVPTQKSCNANCVFCISKERNYDKINEFLDVDDSLIDTILLLKSRGIKRFEVTGGGEPLLNKDISLILKTIKKIIPDSYIKLYTNGNILLDNLEIDEINISLTHNDDEINNKFMRVSKYIPLIEKLEFYHSKYPFIKLRLSLALIKNGIDTIPKLENFILLTEKYVDEYVVRTLYPGTNNRDDCYIDINYEHDKVVFKRDNNTNDFKGNILWSDGCLYTDWSLQEKRFLDSYLLLKPDSRTYINEIMEMICKRGFLIRDILLLDDFKNKALYFYRDKNMEYKSKVSKHLDITSKLFGDQGLIVRLNSFGNLEHLLNATYTLKKDIRSEFDLSNHDNMFVCDDINKYHLNLVHCPNPEIELFNSDLSRVEEFNLRRLEESEVKVIRKYRSYNI